MAKQLSFTDPTDTLFPESYWRITDISIDIRNKTAKIILSGYKNDAARLADKKPIGFVHYLITGDEYTTFISRIINKLNNPQELGYQVATTRVSGFTAYGGDHSSMSVTPDQPFFQSATDV